MVVLEIYSKCLTIKYKTYLLSKATIITILTQIASVVAPILIAFNSKGFWLKHGTLYEQPTVRFKGEYIFSALTDKPSTPILCNNLPYLQRFKNFDKCSLLKVIETDKNNDNKVDELKFSITVEVEELKVQSFNLILFLDYSLNTQCLMKMQSAIIVQYDNVHIANEVNIDAQLGLQQLRPLFCHSRKTNQDYNFSCISDDAKEMFEIRNILQDYSLRNKTDKNNDNKVDELTFSITVEVEELKVQSFNLILFLDYSLNTQCLMKMQSAIIVQYDNVHIANEVNIDAQLGLQQLRPLFCHSRKTNQDYNFSCISEDVKEKFEIRNILQDYSLRNS
ncbi:hypothetical protein FQR65_LT01164 [Abscondita terminalis]|nr:hypothetical protein FQR65_LT01164 [Abscondita terminalis]